MNLFLVCKALGKTPREVLEEMSPGEYYFCCAAMNKIADKSNGVMF